MNSTAAVARSAHARGAERLSYFDVTPGQDPRPECIVLLHGGGSGDSKEPSLALAADLATHGYRVLGLDFTGSGESSGAWSELTLNRRRDQAAALIESCVPAGAPLILAGFSMGGQTATDLAGRFRERVTDLILFAPAIYSRQIRDLPFGSESFGDRVFGRPELWTDSPALEILAAFGGRILLVLPEHDEEIPPRMAGLIEQSLRASARVTIMRLAGAGHLLDHWLAGHPEHRQAVVRALCSSGTSAS